MDEDAVLVLSQIILELKFKEPVRLLKPLLHKICKASSGQEGTLHVKMDLNSHCIAIPVGTFELLNWVERDHLGCSELQGQVVSVGCIVVLRPVGGETWRALVEALRAREPGVVRDICISRQGLPEVIDYMRGGFGTLSTK